MTKIISWNLLRLTGASLDDIVRLIRREHPDLLLMDNCDSSVDYNGVAEQVKAVCPDVIAVLLSPLFRLSVNGDAGSIDRGIYGAAQHVEVAVRLAGRQVDARLDHRLAAALRGEAGLDRRQDLVVGERQLLDIEAIEKGDVDRLHRLPLQPGAGARSRDARLCQPLRSASSAQDCVIR